jgi:hypothetical protein
VREGGQQRCVLVVAAQVGEGLLCTTKHKRLPQIEVLITTVK